MLSVDIHKVLSAEANSHTAVLQSHKMLTLWLYWWMMFCYRHLGIYDFLFDFNRNHASILYHFRDIAGNLSKVADFDPPHMHLAPPYGVIPVEFRGDLWHQKTRLPGLLCGVIFVIIRLAVLVELRRTDTERQTQAHG